MSKRTKLTVDPPQKDSGWKTRQTLEGPDVGIPELMHIGWTHYAETVMEGLTGHRHPGAFEICYIVRGTLTWWVENDILEVDPGDIYITWPDELHGGVDGVMHAAELCWIILDLKPDTPVFGLSAAEVNALLARFDQLTHRRFPGGDAIPGHYRRIMEAMANPGPLTPVHVRATVQLLLLDVLAAFEESRLPGGGARHYAPRIADTIHYLHHHIGDSLTVEELADAAGLRPSYFREEFRRETGFSPVEFLTRLRVREARRLLVETDDPITDLAFRLGYNSSQYFATVFRRHTAMTPSEFRRQARRGETNTRR